MNTIMTAEEARRNNINNQSYKDWELQEIIYNVSIYKNSVVVDRKKLTAHSRANLEAIGYVLKDIDNFKTSINW